MKHEKVVHLEKAARKSGGDRYLAKDGFQIYVPQDISRANSNEPADTIKITFETED